MPSQLTELEADAVVEVFNIGIGRAAASLSRMVTDSIGLSIPQVEVVPRADIVQHMRAEIDGMVVGVMQRLNGELNGNAVLLFTQDHSMSLVRSLLNIESQFDSLNQLEQDALQEIGNIILNACVGTITNMLNLAVQIETPVIKIGPLHSILDNDDDGEWAVSLNVNFNLRDRGLNGRVTFLMDIEAISCLTNGVSNYIGGLSQAETRSI